MASSSYRIFNASPQNLSYSGITSTPRPYGLTSGTGNPGVGIATSFQPQSRSVGLIENAGPNGNSGVLDSMVRSVPQSDRLAGLYKSYDTNKTTDTNSLADYTKNLLATDPTAKSNTDQETGALGDFYNGAIQGHLDTLANNASAANNAAVQRAIGQAGRQNALYRMANGDSSYADRNYADVAAGYANQNAVRDADLRRQNYLQVLAGQQSNLGKRNTLLDSYLQRSLLPSQAGHQLLSSESNDLSGLGYLDSANTQYSMPTYAPPPAAAPSRMSQMLTGQAYRDKYYPGSAPQLNYIGPVQGMGSLQMPTPFVPTYDSAGRPQTQPVSPLWGPPQTPIQNGSFIPNPTTPIKPWTYGQY